jgi:hypothetical protein
VPAITHKNDYVAEGVARLPQQYRDKPKIIAMLSAWLQGVQALEDAIDGVHRAQSIDGALAIGGQPLDALGDLVGQPRNGQDDATYARHIRARIAIHRSQGRVDDVLRIARAILPDAGTYSLTLAPLYPASLSVTIGGLLDSVDEATDIASFIQAGAKAGVRTILLYSLTADAATFSFSAGPGLGFGDSTNPATGGQLSGAV